jgi:hypothetical protein
MGSQEPARNYVFYKSVHKKYSNLRIWFPLKMMISSFINLLSPLLLCILLMRSWSGKNDVRERTRQSISRHQKLNEVPETPKESVTTLDMAFL